MEFQKIEGSSTIAAVGYDKELRELIVKFHSGGIYAFEAVPEQEHEALIQAASVGRQFHQSIRGFYTSRKIS